MGKAAVRSEKRGRAFAAARLALWVALASVAPVWAGILLWRDCQPPAGPSDVSASPTASDPAEPGLLADRGSKPVPLPDRTGSGESVSQMASYAEPVVRPDLNHLSELDEVVAPPRPVVKELVGRRRRYTAPTAARPNAPGSAPRPSLQAAQPPRPVREHLMPLAPSAPVLLPAPTSAEPGEAAIEDIGELAGAPEPSAVPVHAEPATAEPLHADPVTAEPVHAEEVPAAPAALATAAPDVPIVIPEDVLGRDDLQGLRSPTARPERWTPDDAPVLTEHVKRMASAASTMFPPVLEPPAPQFFQEFETPSDPGALALPKPLAPEQLAQASPAAELAPAARPPEAEAPAASQTMPVREETLTIPAGATLPDRSHGLAMVPMRPETSTPTETATMPEASDPAASPPGLLPITVTEPLAPAKALARPSAMPSPEEKPPEPEPEGEAIYVADTDEPETADSPE